MKKTHMFMSSGLVVAVLTIGPVQAQSSSGQSQGSQPPSGTQSGQSTGRSGSADQQKNRGGEKVTSSGEKLGEDVPSAGTDTDQRGRTAAQQSGKSAAGALSGPDRTFLADAMEGNHAEVALAEMAQKKAASQAVRELASMIQRDHQQANDKLTSIAGKIGAAENPTALKPEHKQLQDRLSRLEGAAFDSAYAAEMVKEHQKDIAKYEKASGQLQQAELKAYATQTLPHLKQHLEKSRAAQSQSQSTSAKSH
jgi:putative membrane protein